MSPYLALCLMAYSFGLAIAVIHHYYGPVMTVHFLAKIGLLS
jgi:hypothetical protein